MKKLAALLILSFIASGCGPGQEKLKVAMSLGEAEWAVMRQDVIPSFEKKEGIKVEAVQVEASDLPSMLEAMHKAGRMQVDVFAQDNMRLFLLVKNGLVEDLSAQEGTVPRQVPAALVNSLKRDGRLYFMPYRPNVQVTYYNENKLSKYGIRPPRDWKELLAAAKLLKEKEGVGRVLFKAYGGSPTATQLYEWIVSAGGDPLSLNDEGCVKTFTFLRELWPYLSPDSKRAKFDTTNEYLARESVYIAQNWPFGIGVIVGDYGKKEIKTYSGFRGPAREVHVIGGEVLGIPKGAGHRREALAFIRHLQSREVQNIFVKKLGWPSIRADAYSDVEGWRKPYYDSVRQALAKGVVRKNVSYWSEFEKYINEAFIKIVLQGEPVKKTLDGYHGRLERYRSR